ncbi:hypothetical protein MJ1HA_0943 [Metallosphaera sedula]|nr:hypothetical protein MJ1HA_0943 [Metallosphaera sedula]
MILFKTEEVIPIHWSGKAKIKEMFTHIKNGWTLTLLKRNSGR